MKTRYLRLVKKQRGFTLIELLAVILILGIIALIAIPTVSSVVEQSRRGAAEQSAISFIKSIEEKIITQELSNNKLENGDYSVAQLLSLELGLKGTMPDNGYVTVKDNDVTYCLLSINGYIYICNNDSKEDSESDGEILKMDSNSYVFPEDSTYLGMVYYNPTEGKKCTKNDFESNLVNYNTDLKDSNGDKNQTGLKDGCMIWYIYDDNGDGTFDMILNHNTTAAVAWNTSKTGTTPTTVNAQLESDTSKWKNTARLISVDEVAHICGADEKYGFSSKNDYNIDNITYKTTLFYLNNNTTEDTYKYHWLYDYLGDANYDVKEGVDKSLTKVADNNAYYESEFKNTLDGYWTSDLVVVSKDYFSYNLAWTIGSAESYFFNSGKYYPGSLLYNDAVGGAGIHFSKDIGVRPVITVNKEIFE